MSIDFWELAKDDGIFNEYINVDGLDFERLRNRDLENFSPDAYTFEGHRITRCGEIKILHAPAPLELNITFTPPAVLDKYNGYETGLAIESQTPIWIGDGINLMNRQLILLGTEPEVNELCFYPTPYSKLIYLNIYPLAYDLENEIYVTTNHFSSIEFTEVTPHEFTFEGTANHVYPNWTDFKGTISAPKYDLRGILKVK
jgi:hypothetical protein